MGGDPEREFRRLRRVDLLEMLVDQVEENDLQVAQIEELTELAERLKAKLDEKDAQIERLKAKLDDKDDIIRSLNAGVVPMPGLATASRVPIQDTAEFPPIEPLDEEDGEFPIDIDFEPVSPEMPASPKRVGLEGLPEIEVEAPAEQPSEAPSDAPFQQLPLDMPKYAIENGSAGDEAHDPRLVWFLRR